MSSDATSQPYLEQPGEGEMTLIEHLKELRNRVLVTAIAVVIGVLVCFWFWEDLLGFLSQPGEDAKPGLKLVVFGPTESFFMAMKISLYGGILAASPVAVYQLMAFVMPGLTSKERKLVLPALIGTAFFLILGMAFAYYVILPASLDFLLNFGDQEVETIPQAKLYLDFTLRIIFWIGIAFELPMVIALLARLNIVRAKKVLGFWRYAVVLIFVLAAVITPTPDPITQTFVAGPLVALYVLGIFLAWLVQPKKKDEAAV